MSDKPATIKLFTRLGAEMDLTAEEMRMALCEDIDIAAVILPQVMIEDRLVVRGDSYTMDHQGETLFDFEMPSVMILWNFLGTTNS